MNKDVDWIMINQQEQEQLRSQGAPNIRILGIKGKAFPRCTSFNDASSAALSGFISKQTPLHVYHPFLYISLTIFARPST